MSNNPFDDGFFDDELIEAIGKVESGRNINIPPGQYAVRFEAISYGTTQNGNPKATFRFRVISGEYKGEAYFQTIVFSTSSAQGKALNIHKFKNLIGDLGVFDEESGDAIPPMTSKEDFDKIEEVLNACDLSAVYYVVEIFVEYDKKNKDENGKPREYPNIKIVDMGMTEDLNA